MRKFNDKPCRKCGTVFTPNAPCNLYCSEACAKIVAEEKQSQAMWRHHVKNMTKKGRADKVGLGKGGSNLRYKDHAQYKNGESQFQRLRPVVKERRFCERCSKDLLDVGVHHWCVHHRDHDRTHNELENLELLCKRCHQIEHECWKAFESATTIPEGSTAKQPEAPAIQNG